MARIGEQLLIPEEGWLRFKFYNNDYMNYSDSWSTLSNEYGNQSMLDIYGVELLNESGGFSMDNVESQKAYTYIARRINPMRPVNEVTPEGLSAVF